jgi:hypothetical protein
MLMQAAELFSEGMMVRQVASAKVVEDGILSPNGAECLAVSVQ